MTLRALSAAMNNVARNFAALLIAMIALTASVPARAAGETAPIVFYATRSSFDAAAPALPTEGFQQAHVAAPNMLLQSSPLSSATNDSIFSSGGVLPGLTVSNLNPAFASTGLIVYGDGAILGRSKAVGTNRFGDTLVLSFTPAVPAVGADVFAATSPGRTLAGDFVIEVYNGAARLGTRTFSETRGAIGFIGVLSATPITSVRLLYTTDEATTFADNIAFGSPATTIPRHTSGP